MNREVEELLKQYTKFSQVKFDLQKKPSVPHKSQKRFPLLLGCQENGRYQGSLQGRRHVQERQPSANDAAEPADGQNDGPQRPAADGRHGRTSGETKAKDLLLIIKFGH